MLGQHGSPARKIAFTAFSDHHQRSHPLVVRRRDGLMPRALVPRETGRITAIVIQIESGAHRLALIRCPRNDLCANYYSDGGGDGGCSCAIAGR